MLNLTDLTDAELLALADGFALVADAEEVAAVMAELIRRAQ